jgi:dihydroorotase-like cyclic amidohydrolase
VSSAAGKQGNTTIEEAKAIVAQDKIKATARILDADGTIGKLYDAKTTPNMFVIDAKGILTYAGAIDDNPSFRIETIKDAKNFVREAVNALLAQKPVETAQTPPYGCSVKY